MEQEIKDLRCFLVDTKNQLETMCCVIQRKNIYLWIMAIIIFLLIFLIVVTFFWHLPKVPYSYHLKEQEEKLY